MARIDKNSNEVESESVIIPFDSMEFVELPGGLRQTKIWEKPDGSSAIIMGFSPDSPNGMHFHSNSYQAVVLKGTIKHWQEGESEEDAPVLGPGSSWVQRGGEVHMERYGKDEETLLYIRYDGTTDVFFTNDVEPPKERPESTPNSPLAELESFVMLFEDIEYFQVPPSERMPGGLKIGMLWETTDGRATSIVIYPPHTPSQGYHHHTNTYQSFVISGGVKHWHAGSSEEEATLLGAGSTYVQQGGEDHVHTETYPTDEDTVLFVEWRGKNDVFYAEA